MTDTYLSADELASVFPAKLRQDALTACASLPAVRASGASFPIRLSTDLVTVPFRLYFDTTLIRIEFLTDLQREMVDCLLTRHSDGFTRQRHLARIVGLSHSWIPPFVVQLSGEYVVEILDVICQSLPTLDSTLYKEFLCANPAFLDLTGQRIASYWDCYYRNTRREDYAGFKILEFFRSLYTPTPRRP